MLTGLKTPFLVYKYMYFYKQNIMQRGDSTEFIWGRSEEPQQAPENSPLFESLKEEMTGWPSMLKGENYPRM